MADFKSRCSQALVLARVQQLVTTLTFQQRQLTVRKSKNGQRLALPNQSLGLEQLLLKQFLHTQPQEQSQLLTQLQPADQTLLSTVLCCMLTPQHCYSRGCGMVFVYA